MGSVGGRWNDFHDICIKNLEINLYLMAKYVFFK